MKQRIITGAILVIVLGLFIYFGEGELEFLFSGLCVVLSSLAAFEFSRMLNKEKKFSVLNYLSIPFTFVFTLLSVIFFQTDFFYLIVFVFIISILLIYSLIYVFNDGFMKKDFSEQILTIFYTSLGFIGFAYLRTVSIHLIIYLFIVAMITDVFAYFIGIRFGKRRLAPKISPKKSVEGAIGGLLFGGVIAGLYAYFLSVFDTNIIFIFLISFGLSIIAQIGDLVASKFKREHNIKDYSNLFPGHGGVMDRFDSSAFASIFLMLLVMVIL
jgi:phosphatidate cytidylyltransferase